MPYWEEPIAEEPEEDEAAIEPQPSSEPSEENVVLEDTALFEPIEESVEANDNNATPSLDPGTPIKSGCSTINGSSFFGMIFAIIVFVLRKKIK